MNPSILSAVRCIVAALSLGILADVLLRVGPWGLNAAIFLCVSATCLFAFAQIQRKWFSLPIFLFGLFFVWRDSSVLKALDMLAVGTVAITVALPLSVERLSRTAFAHYLAALCDSAVSAIGGAPQLVWKEMELEKHRTLSPDTKQSWITVATNGGVGLLIAVPLLLLFGALFISADVAFRAFMQHVFDVDWDNLARHALVIAGVSWVLAGFLRMLAFNARADFPLDRTASSFRLDAVSLLIPLALLNALFVTFVCVQFEYFFGGNALVTGATGPTYAEYARQGFFQLVAVAVLALLVLYAADWLNREARPAARKWFRILAATLIVLVYIVMASALHRMYLYYDAYGLTQLRFYTTAFMFWLAIVIASFAATVLIARRERFLFIGVSTAWLAIVALHAINPDALIVRANVARMADGKPLDSKYLGRALSADAVPAARSGHGRENEANRAAPRGAGYSR